MTFNFSTLFIVFVGAIFRGATVFSVVQLLWLNMIMDTLAALALAAEKPKQEAIKDKPVEKKDSIITTDMWRQILGITLYSSLVMFIMFWFNEDIWGFNYTMSDPDTSNLDSQAAKDLIALNQDNKKRAFTMLFNIFVYIHLFNMINCREIKPTRRNVFKGMTSNYYFIGIFFAIVVIQYSIVQFGVLGAIFSTAKLTGEQ